MSLTAPATLRRFLVLTGLRWLPTGFVIPVSVLLMQQRGLSLTRIGLVMAVQGVVVFALELPTGAFADTLGRRVTLLIAGAFACVALVFLATGTTLAAFAAYYGLMGIYRALDSGPLDAWYVDAAQAADPHADIEKGLAAGAAVLSAAVAGGALLAGAVVALAPVATPLVAPVVIAIGLQAAHVVAVAVLMHEPHRSPVVAPRGALRDVGAVITGALTLVRGSRVLAALVSVEVFWGFGMATFETLFPPRLAEVMDGPTAAAALLGPAASAAWVASAAGAALVAVAVRRFGAVRCAVAGRLLQAGTVAVMGLVAGPAGLLAAYLATYLIHGAANPVHQALLHRRVAASHRTTIVSLNSMMSQPGGALGAVVLGALADAVSLSAAMLVGAVVLGAAAPLYLPARRPVDAEHTVSSRA